MCGCEQFRGRAYEKGCEVVGPEQLVRENSNQSNCFGSLQNGISLHVGNLELLAPVGHMSPVEPPRPAGEKSFGKFVGSLEGMYSTFQIFLNFHTASNFRCERGIKAIVH